MAANEPYDSFTFSDVDYPPLEGSFLTSSVDYKYDDGDLKDGLQTPTLMDSIDISFPTSSTFLTPGSETSISEDRSSESSTAPTDDCSNGSGRASADRTLQISPREQSGPPMLPQPTPSSLSHYQSQYCSYENCVSSTQSQPPFPHQPALQSENPQAPHYYSNFPSSERTHPRPHHSQITPQYRPDRTQQISIYPSGINQSSHPFQLQQPQDQLHSPQLQYGPHTPTAPTFRSMQQYATQTTYTLRNGPNFNVKREFYKEIQYIPRFETRVPPSQVPSNAEPFQYHPTPFAVNEVAAQVQVAFPEYTSELARVPSDHVPMTPHDLQVAATESYSKRYGSTLPLPQLDTFEYYPPKMKRPKTSTQLIDDNPSMLVPPMLSSAPTHQIPTSSNMGFPHQQQQQPNEVNWSLFNSVEDTQQHGNNPPHV